MRDSELYRHRLGLVTPWEVERVELSVHDHCEVRAWRHLDSCAFLTFLHANPPRASCPEHGVRQVRSPWAEPHSRFTLSFERLAINVSVAVT